MCVFIHLPMAVFTFMNDVNMNSLVEASVWTDVLTSLGYSPRSRTAGSQGST